MDTADLLAFREQKNQFFKLAPQSPVPAEERDTFTELSYFDPNPDLVFSVELQPVEPTDIQISTTTGENRVYKRVATVAVQVDGEDVSLALYSSGHDSLFLPFRDSTSGKDTYGAGRYLDIEPTGDGKVVIDFNYAYAPFCAYSDRYSCALPPAENWLTVAIRAGERNPA